MLDKSFTNLQVLQKSLNASWLRNEAIANNIANINTPGYKKDVVEFEEVLRNSLSGTSLKGSLTHPKHIPVGSMDINRIEPTLKKDMYSKFRKDGNNVNIDVEMANLAKNTVRYNAMIQRISGKLSKLKMVIKDGR